MCGRYAFFAPADAIARLFDLEQEIPVEPSYNVAPTDYVPAVREVGGHRSLSLLKWGLIPFWAKEPKIGVKMINARAETVAEKPAFKNAFHRRRCLLPANGFFEWQKTNQGKVPHFIGMADGEPFAFAGLWERWGKGAEQIESVTIVTTEPNELVSQLHDRMPAILARDAYDSWLKPDLSNPSQLLPLLCPYAAKDMRAFPVSKAVNDPRNKSEQAIEPSQDSLF